MLVLSRKLGEQIVIDDRIKITILRISGNRIRIGVEAPKEMTIRRPEVEPIAEPIAHQLERR